MVAETISFALTKPRTLQEALHFAGELTAEEFYGLHGDGRYELTDGKVSEKMPPGYNHGTVAGNIYTAIKLFLRKHDLGQASVEGGFRLSREPHILRSPDVSFVTHASLTDQNANAFLEGAPDLAVEVNSPNDMWHEVEAKVALYFQAGTRAVWIVEPTTRTITVRTPDNAPMVYQIDDTLRGEPVLAGFEMALGDVFDF